MHYQGVGCLPWCSLGFRPFCGTIMCSAKGSDVRPGVPWVCASFAWEAQCAPPRDRMYALPWVSASFAWLTHTHLLTLSHTHRSHSHYSHTHTIYSHYHSLTFKCTYTQTKPLHHDPSSKSREVGYLRANNFLDKIKNNNLIIFNT